MPTGARLKGDTLKLEVYEITMKKSFIKAAFVAVFASIANYGVYTSQQKVEMLDLEWPMWKRWLINL